MNIDWRKLKSGFSSFETIAVDLVNDKDNDNHYKWIQTKGTRDHNHDGILVKEKAPVSTEKTAVFVGYTHNNIDVWWMEAKYSAIDGKKEQVMPRYRLDATIVSAILSKKIKKVVFVTNLNIASKTIFDLRKALISSTSCQEVVFYTRTQVEFWLLHQPFKYFKTYFPSLARYYNQISISNPVIESGLELYGIGNNLFKESLTIVYTGFAYELHFTVTTQEELRIVLDKAINLQEIPEDMKDLKLKPGENCFCFNTKIPKKIQHEPIHSKDVPGEYKAPLHIELVYKTATGDLLSISPKGILDIVDSDTFLVDIPSQADICKELTDITINSLNNENMRFSIALLEGKSGVGKSFVLQRYRQELSARLNNSVCNYYQFNGDLVIDSRLVKQMLMFVLFPYIDYANLDRKYMENLQEVANMPTMFWEFVSPKEDLESFMKFYNNWELISTVLTTEIHVNARILICDDLHKLDDRVSSVFYDLIKLFEIYNYPVFLVISSQRSIDSSKKYMQPICKKQLEISSDDVKQVLKRIIANLELDNPSPLFGSVPELICFIKYLSQLGKEINSYEELRLFYNLYKRSKILKNEIITKFKQVFAQHENVIPLCSCIYYTSSGIHMQLINEDSELRKAKDILVSEELIKKDENDYYTAWHDTYKEIYRSTFELVKCKEIEIPFQNTYDKKNLFVLQGTEENAICILLDSLKKLYSEQKFYSIYYILENIYTQKEKREQYKNQISSKHYYMLFAYFCYANTNASSQYSGFEMFSELYHQTQNNKNIIIQSIHYIILWELINCLYESGNYEKAMSHVELFEAMPESVKCNWAYLFEWDYNSLYNSVRSADLLIQSEKGINCISKIPRPQQLHNKDISYTSYRLILSNLTNDYANAMKLLRSYNQIIQDDVSFDHKSKYAYDFTVKFFDCVENKIDISEVIDANNIIKQEFLNDYNRHICIISALALIKKGLDLCETYSLEYLKSSRPLKYRQKAFQEALFALICLAKEKKSDAIAHLKKEQEIFSEYENYLPVISHNIKFIEECSFSITAVDFYIGKSMESGKYYIDIRMLY